MNIKLELSREQAILLVAFFDTGNSGVHKLDDLPDRVIAADLLHEFFVSENEDDVCNTLNNKINEIRNEIKDEANLILHKMQGDINGELKS